MEIIIIVGGDALALRVCEDLCDHGHHVTVLWDGDADFAGRVGKLGAKYLGKRPEEHDSLRAAGILTAATVMALSIDDHRNVQVILRSRDLNPNVRIVLRQYNRQLGRKIEQNLANCSVLSRSTHAAATYAAAAVDPDCFYALQFPDIDGTLVGFSRVRAERERVVGMTPAQAERALNARVLAVGDVRADSDSSRVIAPDDELIIFRTVCVRDGHNRHHSPGSSLLLRAREAFTQLGRSLRHSDPVVRAVLATVVTIFTAAVAFFTVHVKMDPFTAAYFVITTMTTTGYGDITPSAKDSLSRLAAMFLMVSGVMFTGTFIAIVASRLTRAQWVSLHGLRKIHRRGHFVVCGAGQVGASVIDFLLCLGQSVVVIEADPTSTVMERSRERQFDLITGDATEDAVLELCNLPHARGLIALTQSDTMNLEAALGARAHKAELPIVMRVNEVGLATSIKWNFGLDRTFGTAALSAPAFADLALHPGARGRVMIGEHEYAIIERDANTNTNTHANTNTNANDIQCANDGVPLAFYRRGGVMMPWEREQPEPSDRALFLLPITSTR